MKVIDFDKKIAEVKNDLVNSVPKTELPKTEIAVNEQLLKGALKVISNELLKDPVIVSLMNLRNTPTPQNLDVFIGNVKLYIDYATAVRYKEYLKGVFSKKEVKNDQTV